MSTPFFVSADRMLIGGQLVHSTSGEFDISIDPATEEPLGRSPRGTREDVSRAVEAAEAAWPAWAAMSPLERGRVMRRFGEALTARAGELLEVEVRDTGNTITPMRYDVKVAVDSLEFYGGLAGQLLGDTIPSSAGNIHLTLREPYGVVARIVPFNHPVMFSVAKTAAALAAGNAVVVKPPETSPLSAMVLAEIARDTLPAGVFNIVTGPGATVGDAIVTHPGIKRIAFIGSTRTGLQIQRRAAESGVKHVSLELGGKNPFIVFPDNDPEEIAQAALEGMNFGWAGQSCGSTSRLLLHHDIHDRVVEALVERVRTIRPGNPLHAETGIGPVNSRAQYDKALSFIETAKNDGSKLLCGGRRPEGEMFQRGYWLEPTIYSAIKPGMRLWDEEVFGPILSIGRWSTRDEAVELANATDYGLTAAVWGRNIDEAFGLIRRIRAGYTWINGVGSHFLGVPFGGMKQSGTGREGGMEELYSYTEAKTVNVMLRAQEGRPLP